MRVEKVSINSLGQIEARFEGIEDPHGLGGLSRAKRRMLESNPCVGPDDPAVFVAVVEQDGRERIVGRLDVVPAAYRVQGSKVRIWFGSDFRVPPAERGTMAALVLLSKMKSVCGVCAASNPSRMATELYRKLGWTDVPLVRRIVPLDGRTAVRKFIRWPIIREISIFVASGARPLHLLLCLLLCLQRRYEVVSVERRCDPESEALASRERTDDGPVRDGPRLRWLLDNQRTQLRGEGALVIRVRDRKSGAVGMALLSLKRYPENSEHPAAGMLVASIRDWVDSAGSVSRSALVKACLRQAVRSNADFLEICSREGDQLPVPWFVPSFVRGAQHMMFDLHASGEGRAAISDVRPGDGEAFWS